MIPRQGIGLSSDVVSKRANQLGMDGIRVEEAPVRVVNAAEKEAVVGPFPDLAQGVSDKVDAINRSGNAPTGIIHLPGLRLAGRTRTELEPGGLAGREAELHRRRSPVAAGPPAVAIDAGKMKFVFDAGSAFTYTESP